MNKRIVNIAGWLVFAIALLVYFFSVERVGSLWDVGEFITGAYKLQVVHPPGAPLFLLIGRLFAWFAELFSDTDANPSNIAFAVNMLSGICTAFAALFVAWTTMLLAKLAQVGRVGTLDRGAMIATAGAGVVAGLATAFTSSIWFSAVEGEVYAMSTMFTALVLWITVKWYHLPDVPKSDRWLALGIYAAALSIGVHLLSLLTFPALALFYYFKKFEKHTLWGGLLATVAGGAVIVIIQRLIIVGIPSLWAKMELLMVNGLGAPFHSGLIPTFLIVGGVLAGGIYYSSKKMQGPAAQLVQLAMVATTLAVIGFSMLGVVVIRANANTPINMNNPSDAFRLIPYLNREQYGERPLLYGPHYLASPVDSETEERYGRLGDKYQIVDEKVSYVYDDKDKMLLPRMSDSGQGRPGIYPDWVGIREGEVPSMGDNLTYLFRYQIGWMYWRYFFWNFAGRQNGDQGYYAWDKSAGNWLSGIGFIDEARLHNMDELPETARNNAARNTYYFLPIIFGLLGIFFHFKNRPKDALALLVLFIITGIGIIIYSNQPPNEPRERDYVLVGSFFTFCIWIGMAVPGLYQLFREKANFDGVPAAGVALALSLSAPLIMGFQNFDDHSRRHHTASRDYAANFLNSLEENAIIFTYGDNDTYPLWYAQETEGIRTDVRVVNLSLIAVDWYIDQLRRKVNDSPPIKMTIPETAYRGRKRNYTPYYNARNQGGQYNPANDQAMTVEAALNFIGNDANQLRGQGGRMIDSYLPSRKLFLPVDKAEVLRYGVVQPEEAGQIVDRIPVSINKNNIIKDELAILDLIGSNVWERPVYFAVTVRPEKMFGLQDYTQLEGLALRLVPIKTPSQSQQYGIYGSGRVATDIVYDNMMNRFAYGNFDKEQLFVDRSYGPSVQSHRVVVMRAAREMMAQGKTDMAVALVEKYLASFPHMNFPYDFSTTYMLDILVQAKAYDALKPHLRTLAEETRDQLEFFTSLTPDELQAGFEQDAALYNRTADIALRMARQTGDQELIAEVEEKLGAYASQAIPN